MLRRRWVRHVIIAPVVGLIMAAAVASRIMPAATGLVGSLDGESYLFGQKVKFKTESGKWDFNFAYRAFGSELEFGGDGPSTFSFIGAGPKVDGIFVDLSGTYTEPTPDQFVLNFSMEADNLIDLRVRAQLLKDARQQDIKGLDANTTIDLPDVSIAKTSKGRVIMDLPPLQLVTPPSHTFHRNRQRALTGGAPAHDDVQACEGGCLPATGPSDARTAATGAAIAVAASIAIGIRRRRFAVS